MAHSPVAVAARPRCRADGGAPLTWKDLALEEDDAAGAPVLLAPLPLDLQVRVERVVLGQY